MRRSGIANLVGAVFFILIVVLMVGALAAMFGTFNSFIDGQHVSNASTEQAQQTSLDVKNLTFGGLTSYNDFNFTANGAVNLVANTNQHPLLPITNMNFTGNMQGWTTSHTYKLVTDSATVQFSPQLITYNDSGILPNGHQFPSLLYPIPTFSLSVTNNNPPGSTSQIAGVTILIDQKWGVPAQTCPTPPPSIPPCPVSWGSTRLISAGPPIVTGNNLTWVSDLPVGIAAGQTVTFPVTVNVPQVYGTFFDTVVLSWLSTTPPFLPYTDTAVATVNSTVTQVEVSPSGTTGTSSANVNCANIACAPIGSATSVASSGLTAGYDANALTTTSESGPGSMYLDFKPSFNSAPITDGQQLTATADFTTAFSLDSKTALGILTAGCCTLTWESSLDGINSARNSLIVYQAYFTNPAGVTFQLPIGGTSCGVSPNSSDYVNPTTVNEFGPTGWVLGQVCFDPSTGDPAWLNAGAWYAGQYTLTIAVTMTVPGAIPQTSGYPPEVSIHLDDIGLAFKQAPATYYGTRTFQIPTGLTANQVQGLEVGVNATGTNQNTTIYAYINDNSHFVYNPPNWVQIGSASFINSAVIDSVSPLPNAAYYVNSTAHVLGGKAEVGEMTIRVNATSAVATAPYSVQLAVWAVIQTFNQTRLTVELQNQSPAPIRLLSMVITGPGNALSYTFATNYYFGPGQKLVMPETFTWIPGSTYTVTVTTSSGLTFSRSFPAPLA